MTIARNTIPIPITEEVTLRLPGPANNPQPNVADPMFTDSLSFRIQASLFPRVRTMHQISQKECQWDYKSYIALPATELRTWYSFMVSEDIVERRG